MIKIERNKNTELYENWHSNVKIINNGDTIYLSNNPSGCGQMILHGWARVRNNEKMKDSLIYLLDIIQNKNGKINYLPYLRSLDIGSIITTVGDRYYNNIKISTLEKVGFKCVSEYRNPRHGKKDTQRLYIWTIK